MKLDLRDGRHRATTVLFGVGLLIATAASAGGAGTIGCQDGDPAVPVDQFRTISGQGTIELWPENLRPADPIGLPLPSERDSTSYNGFQRPGEAGGLEFFYDLDVLENSAGSYLFMAYNSGFQIWNIAGAFGAAPQLLSQRDGWAGDFHDFEPTTTEFYFLIWDISAIDPVASNATLVALAGDSSSVGLTIWDAANKLSPFQLYQDTSRTGIQVATANISGRTYAFVGSTNGIHVYDMTRAREVGPCYENSASATNLCGGNSNPVWRGRLEPWPWGRARYLDVMQTATETYLVVSDAFVSNSLGVEIRRMTNASSLPPTSTGVVEGLSTLTFGVDLFEYSGRYYVGTTDLSEVSVYDVSPCITSSAGCNFNNVKGSFDTVQSDFSYVQYSESNGRPFLYKSFHTLCSRPSTTSEGRPEFLLDLSGLATGGAIVDVIGESYQDPNHSSPQRVIDYWSSYYDQSTDGFSTFAPHGGMFHKQYFYRGAQTLFDVHEFLGDVPVTAQVNTTSSGRWLSTVGQLEWVELDGVCSEGVGTGWSWSAANAPGTPVADPAPVIQNLGGGAGQVRGDLCAVDLYPVSSCIDRTIEVDLDVTCDGTPVSAETIEVTLSDPRPFFEAVEIVEIPNVVGPPPEYPVCQILNFRALNGEINEIEGKALTSFNWDITPLGGGDTLSCNAATAGTGLACDETSLEWDTQEVDVGNPNLIFTDGFESGNTSAWGGEASEGGTLGVVFDVTLTATNEHGSLQHVAQLAITPLETLAFTGNGFEYPATPPGDGVYDFVATAESATTYRWEFEQSAGVAGDPGCQFVTPCEIRTTNAPTLQYQWPQENITGDDYEVWLEISNCDSSAIPLSVMRTVPNVTVINASAPEIDHFRVVTVGTDCTCLAGTCICPLGSTDFTVDVTGECDTLNITWGDGGVSNGLACDDPLYTHTYNSTGTFDLEAEACLGSLCETQFNLTNISPALPVPLVIE